MRRPKACCAIFATSPAREAPPSAAEPYRWAAISKQQKGEETLKTLGRVIATSLLFVLLAACDSFASTPTISSTEIMGTAISLVKTQTVITLTTFPTDTPTPLTPIPAEAHLDQPSPPPADKLDYAMATAQKIYTRFPYIGEAIPSGEYSGCIETFDFHNFVVYPISLPIESVNTAFLAYFQIENWEFTEAIQGSIGNDTSLQTIMYDVYRISSNDKPAFERLKIVLSDTSNIRGENSVDVRVELTHVETKENLQYLLDPVSCNGMSWWLWIRLTK
jgi:hypothetical protein